MQRDPGFLNFLKQPMFFADIKNKGRYCLEASASGRLTSPDEGRGEQTDDRSAICLSLSLSYQFGSRPVRSGGRTARGSDTF